jgi:hypothetical protein
MLYKISRRSSKVRMYDKLCETNMLKLNSVAWAPFERTIQTERPPLIGEVSAKFCG